MAKDKKDKKYPEKFEDSDCNGDGNCKDCVDNDICDVLDDDWYDYDVDYDVDVDHIDYDDDWSDDCFNNTDMQGYV